MVVQSSGARAKRPFRWGAYAAALYGTAALADSVLEWRGNAFPEWSGEGAIYNLNYVLGSILGAFVVGFLVGLISNRFYPPRHTS